MPDEQLRRNGVDPQEVAPIVEAIGAGDTAKGIELTTPDLADRLSVARARRLSGNGPGGWWRLPSSIAGSFRSP
jgi:hypothetical protein